VALAALLGTYLGIWLQQISFKYTPAGIAQALLATSPLFVLPLAAASGDRISWRAILGVLVAIGGIWLLISNP
jgi:drug/metabolite transporter (DMT)-like permease